MMRSMVRSLDGVCPRCGNAVDLRFDESRRRYVSAGHRCRYGAAGRASAILLPSIALVWAGIVYALVFAITLGVMGIACAAHVWRAR